MEINKNECSKFFLFELRNIRYGNFIGPVAAQA
jgi:hypothetical protein